MIILRCYLRLLAHARVLASLGLHRIGQYKDTISPTGNSQIVVFEALPTVDKVTS